MGIFDDYEDCDSPVDDQPAPTGWALMPVHLESLPGYVMIRTPMAILIEGLGRSYTIQFTTGYLDVASLVMSHVVSGEKAENILSMDWCWISDDGDSPTERGRKISRFIADGIRRCPPAYKIDPIKVAEELFVKLRLEASEHTKRAK